MKSHIPVLPGIFTTPVESLTPDSVRFAGAVYEPARDNVRLTGQLQRIYAVLKDGAWRTLDELATLSAAPPASVSAQLRHLRKPEFGAHVIEKRRRGTSEGLWEYRLKKNSVGD